MPRDQDIIYEDLAPAADLTAEKSASFDAHALSNMVLLVQTKDATGSAPVTPVIAVLVEESFDNVNWVAVTGWAIANITATGTQHAKDPEPERVGRYLRTSTTTTYITPNGRTAVRVWLSGESRI